MKNNRFFYILMIILVSLPAASAVFAQTQTLQLFGTVDPDAFFSRMVWNDEGNVLTLVSRDSVERFAASADPAVSSTYSFGGKKYIFSTVSEAGTAAAVTEDRNTILLIDPEDPDKEVRTIEPGFSVLSVSVSKDGTQVLADSADQIRSVVYETSDGSLVHDLSGFHTAAPVYDSVLSPDKTRVLWHSRGTFAVQNIGDGSFGETISLWDFASAYDLTPDNSLLAVAIINDDYESGAVIFFDPVSGQEKGRTLTGSTSPYELSFSEDGSVVWAADTQYLYKIDTGSFEILSSISVTDPDSDVRISRIASTPDGNGAAVLCSDGQIFLTQE